MVLKFTFDEGANGYLSQPVLIENPVTASIELASAAPVVTLKQKEDGDWANYGQSPKDARCYKINIVPKERMIIRIASPVEVLKGYII